MMSMLGIFHRLLRLCVELPLRCIFFTYYVVVYLVVEMPRWRTAAGHRIHPGTAQRTGLWCICAIAQGRRVSQNLIAFLSCLKSSGYNVLLVNNGNLSSDLINGFLPHCHSVIERPHGGRDFGGYKWGTRALLSM